MLLGSTPMNEESGSWIPVAAGRFPVEFGGGYMKGS